jgi:hypothetical protein
MKPFLFKSMLLGKVEDKYIKQLTLYQNEAEQRENEVAGIRNGKTGCLIISLQQTYSKIDFPSFFVIKKVERNKMI